ncbi:YqjF family protein [Deinococcus sp. NW-56]|uniref:YqjF family protein n=1 Tax=Deinococcus sp. NW-56 TaxID=2080419 RepID=UPI000CF3A9D0|nr:DUF2071 domain-containing protein [Deinococcus sp. NW-56]
MTWLDLCFLHWPVPPEALAPSLPPGLQLDLWQGQAWVGIVPFRMAGVAPRFSPDMPRVSAFPELNLRTYVTAQGVPGVWFYSLDAAQPLAVRLARRLFHLPYFDARMWVDRRGEITRYASMRTHRRAPEGHFAAAFRPVGPVFQAAGGTLEDWLTHRLALYSADRRGRLYRGQVHHDPWRLRRAEARIAENTLAAPLNLRLKGEPHLLYAQRTEVRADWLTPVRVSPEP